MWFFKRRKKNVQIDSDFFVSTHGSKEYFSLPGKFKYTWVSEFFSSRKDDDDVRNHDQFLGNALSSHKIIAIGICCWVLLLVLLGRVGSLQLFHGRSYLLAAETNRFRYYADPAPRGIIYDRFGSPLVKNIPSFSLAIAPRDILPYHDRREKLRALLSLSPEAFDEVVDIPNAVGRESLLIKENLSYEDMVRIRIAAAEIPGIFVQNTSYREYDLERIPGLSHVLGYVGRMNAQEWETLANQKQLVQELSYTPNDTLGKQGIEKTYEHLLRGVFGKVQVEVDAKGRHGREVTSVRAIAGTSLILTLDAALQEELEKIMRTWMERLQKTRASAVAIDPRNGEVLALISLPAFDSNIFSRGIPKDVFSQLLNDPDRPLFTRSISGQYPSGSTIKPFMAAAALQEGVITPATTFLSNGGINVSRWFFKDWRAGGHGITDVRKAIADSVNTFFYIIGGGYGGREGLGPARIAAYLQQFGFASPTGIDIPGELAGFIPTTEWKEKTKKEQWYVGDTYNLSIGQGDLLVTPLQLAVATAAVANGGTLYKPRLLKGIGNSTTSTEKMIDEPLITNAKIIEPHHLAVVREGMRQTVATGSAARLASVSVPVAGKTGTAQWNSNAPPHAWFASFAPYEHPEITLVVLVEEGVEGATIAAGIAKDFYVWWAKER